ncbi:hypothetical protein RDI58_023548 [Solanum bulbocastanum]|uniref:Uncharacterized protein n=1 Tax=Solanum bulbocastanum TaxID=147425 RepID=A0AAN8T4S0_SOLBU
MLLGLVDYNLIVVISIMLEHQRQKAKDTFSISMSG